MNLGDQPAARTDSTHSGMRDLHANGQDAPERLRSDYGRIAYEAYSQAAGGRSLVTSQTLPEWDDLPLTIRAAWREAAKAVHEATRDAVAIQHERGTTRH